MQIVLAWVDEGAEPVGAWRADLGERPKMRPVRVARAAMWLRQDMGDYNDRTSRWHY